LKLRIPDFRSPIGLRVSLLAVALSAGVAQAQKIAIIDMQQSVLATSDGKKAAAAIDGKFAPVKAQLDQLQKDIVAKQDQYTKTRSTLSATASAAAQAEIEKLTTDLKRKQEDAQQDLQDEESKLLGGIVPKLEQIINSYAAANQISFVVDTSASPNNLIYADKSLNIIAAVVTAYEKASGTPASSAPAASTAPKAPAATAPKPPAATAPKPPAATAPNTTTPAK
jgi:outer membrane protein